MYIELLDEDHWKAKGFVGLLKKAMYGTRSAPQAWQNLVRSVRCSLGVVASVVVPSLFYHSTRGITVCTHVDDLLCSGKGMDLRWL